MVIASEVPGETVPAYTTVTGNHIWGNGLAGVTIHVHEPNQNFNGTKITGNWIGQNNILGDPIGLFGFARPPRTTPFRKPHHRHPGRHRQFGYRDGDRRQPHLQ